MNGMKTLPTREQFFQKMSTDVAADLADVEQQSRADAGEYAQGHLSSAEFFKGVMRTRGALHALETVQQELQAAARKGWADLSGFYEFGRMVEMHYNNTENFNSTGRQFLRGYLYQMKNYLDFARELPK